MPLPMFDQSSKKTKNEFKNILAIAAGKGGVGKSTLTVNLGLALHKLGFKVGILDADIYGPSLRRMLIEDRLPSQKGEDIFPALASGIKLISMAYFRSDQQASSVRAPIANGVITQFIDKVQWGYLDFLLLDFPPGTGDVQLTLCQKLKITGALMITTPQEVALQDVRKAIHLFEQVKIPIIGVVENMSYYDHVNSDERLYLLGKGGGLKLSQEKGVPYLGEIPIDPLLSLRADQGKSIFEKDFETLSTKVFKQIADKLLSHLDLLKFQSSKSTDLDLAWDDQYSKKDSPPIAAPECKPQDSQMPVFIEKLQQVDPQTLAILWSDQLKSCYTLNFLQENCPCANCTQSPKLNPEKQVSAKRIRGIGRYALRIEFTSGCSTGIFSYDLLRHLAKEQE